jgi:hypothetical protein
MPTPGDALDVDPAEVEQVPSCCGYPALTWQIQRIGVARNAPWPTTNPSNVDGSGSDGLVA